MKATTVHSASLAWTMCLKDKKGGGMECWYRPLPSDEKDMPSLRHQGELRKASAPNRVCELGLKCCNVASSGMF